MKIATSFPGPFPSQGKGLDTEVVKMVKVKLEYQMTGMLATQIILAVIFLQRNHFV